MMDNIIEATILNVKFKGEDVLLPCIPMILTDMSLKFKRLQYPVRLTFAMTINKSQGLRNKTKFGKSMLLTWTNVCGLLTRWKTFRFIRVHTRRKNKKYCIFKSPSINTIKTK
jgi:hypothetical protein